MVFFNYFKILLYSCHIALVYHYIGYGILLVYISAGTNVWSCSVFLLSQPTYLQSHEWYWVKMAHWDQGRAYQMSTTWFCCFCGCFCGFSGMSCWNHNLIVFSCHETDLINTLQRLIFCHIFLADANIPLPFFLLPAKRRNLIHEGKSCAVIDVFMIYLNDG